MLEPTERDACKKPSVLCFTALAKKQPVALLTNTTLSTFLGAVFAIVTVLTRVAWVRPGAGR